MNTDSIGIKTMSFKFPEVNCREMIEIFEAAMLTEPATAHESIPNKPNAMARNDFYHILDVFEPKHAILVNEYLDKAFQEYSDTFPILREENIYSIKQKIQKTPVGGGFHRWHCDNLSPTTSRRILVWMIYLNTVDEGGETEFLYQSERTKPEQGKIVLAPADFMHTHRGNPPISNDKYIITGFFNISTHGEDIDMLLV
jgi:hypothetical protein